jgi:hypothetical protein
MSKGLVISFIGVVVVTLYLLYPLVSSVSQPFSGQLSAYQSGPNSLYEFGRDIVDNSKDVQYVVLNTASSPSLLDTIQNPEKSLLIIVGAERGYNSAEIDSIEGFVRRGGKIIIAEDSERVNSLSSRLFVNFIGRSVWDHHYEKSPDFIIESVTLSNAPSNLKSIIEDEGGVWIGTFGRGIYRYDAKLNLWTNYATFRGTLTEGISSDYVLSTAKDATDYNVTWFGTTEGVSKYNSNTNEWGRFTVSDGLVSNRIQAIGCSEDSIWFGTNANISRYKKSTNEWYSYTTKHGLVYNDVRTIAIDGGDVWFGTTNGTSRYDVENDIWTTYSVSNGLANNYVYSIAVDRDTIWFGTGCGASAYSKNRNMWINYTISEPNSIVYTISVDGNTIWFGTNNGISRFDKQNNRWNSYTVKDGLTYRVVHSIVVKDGDVWIGTSRGASRYNVGSNRWTSYPLFDEAMNTGYEILLHKPIGLSYPLGRAKELSKTTNESYLDRNPNSIVDASDRRGSVPLIAEVSFGKGKAVFIGDAGMFTSSMIDQYDNGAFLTTLVQYMLPSGGEVIFEESRHMYNPYLESECRSAAFVINLVSSKGNDLGIGTSRTLIYPIALTITISILALVIVTIESGGIESWIHRFDVKTFKPRGNLPITKKAKQARLLMVIKEKARAMSGISFEEAKTFTEKQIINLIEDPTIRNFIVNPEKNYTEEEIKKIVVKLEEWRK